MRAFAEKNYDLIIGVGFAQGPIMQKVATDYPNIKFAIVDGVIMEEDGKFAGAVSEIFTREETSVRIAHTLEEAIDSCFTFRPHLLVLNIALPDGDGFNLVDWLRQHESLVRLALVVYARPTLTDIEHAHIALGPTHFLTTARTQPQQLEALVLTMLRNPAQVEEVAHQV